MSTKSFDKTFIVKNQQDIKRFNRRLNENHKVIVVKDRDFKTESKKGVERLKNIW